MAAAKVGLTPNDLTTLEVVRVIIHDIPKRPHAGGPQPTLSEVESDVDGAKVKHIRDRLKRALGAPRAYAIQFDPKSASPVPGQIRAATAEVLESKDFVQMSHTIANYLFEQQTGVTSPGLLVVMDCVVHGEQAVALLKLEREEGFQIGLTQKAGKQTFDLAVLNNLVLTDGTRFFKSALFHRTGEGDDDFHALACDDQTADQMAQFWRRFLGCALTEQPRIVTQRFFETALAFVSERVPDPVEKAKLYDHVLSEFNSEKKVFVPKQFIEHYVPSKHRQAFQEYLTENQVTLKQFTVDVSEIAPKLKKRYFVTERGAVVTAPADVPNLIKVEKHQIVVADAVKKVDHK